MIENGATPQQWSKLESMFEKRAEEIASVIIQQIHLPNHLKSIKPSSTIGGLAGGSKYEYDGILFKIACDEHQIYGSDTLASKGATNELRAIRSVRQCHIPFLHTTLSGLFYIHGYHVMAIALAPIRGKHSLVYGSSDAGKTVHNKSESMRKYIEQLARNLNLKRHLVAQTTVEMDVAGDVEGHHSDIDGRLYLIDLARLFPPTVPKSGL